MIFQILLILKQLTESPNLRYIVTPSDVQSTVDTNMFISESCLYVSLHSHKQTFVCVLYCKACVLKHVSKPWFFH